MDSEQPKSLDEIMNEANSESLSSLFDNAMVLGLGVLAIGYRMDGHPKIADKAEEIADKIVLKRITKNARALLQDGDIEIIDGEVIGTEHGLGEITDKI